MQLFTGKVKDYDPQTGKGLIEPEGGGEDVSVDLQRLDKLRLSNGQKVRFRMIHGRNRIYAYDIELI